MDNVQTPELDAGIGGCELAVDGAATAWRRSVTCTVKTAAITVAASPWPAVSGTCSPRRRPRVRASTIPTRTCGERGGRRAFLSLWARTFWAMTASVSPSSAASNTSVRLSIRALHVPFVVNATNSARSSGVNPTTYFFTDLLPLRNGRTGRRFQANRITVARE